MEKRCLSGCCAEQGYTYLPLHTEDELIANLRSQLEELNHYQVFRYGVAAAFSVM